VLVVEDHPEVIDLVADLLADRFLVLKARDGEEGLALAREHVPDAVLSDVMMPGMDGLALTRALREDRRTSHIPVVLLTARVGHEDRLAGWKAGADAYLDKPFDPEELLLRMEQLLDARSRLQSAFGAAWPANADAPAASPARTVPQAPTPDAVPDGPSPERLAQESAFLAEARDAVMAHLDEEGFGAKELARVLGLSHTQAYRKIRALTGSNPTLFIRSVRLAEARRLLRETDCSVSEIAYRVGFQQPAYFTRAYKAEFGEPPSEARN
jgi:CheY-like chemotaxis protein/AraC-like DNA-binding protein